MKLSLLPPGKSSALRVLAACAAALSFTSAALAETVVQQWATRFSGTANSTDTHNALTVDAAGDVYSCGRVRNAGTAYDFHVVKYSGNTGAVIWSYTRHGNRSTSTSTFDVARRAFGANTAAPSATRASRLIRRQRLSLSDGRDRQARSIAPKILQSVEIAFLPVEDVYDYLHVIEQNPLTRRETIDRRRSCLVIFPQPRFDLARNGFQVRL